MNSQVRMWATSLLVGGALSASLAFGLAACGSSPAAAKPASVPADVQGRNLPIGTTYPNGDPQPAVLYCIPVKGNVAHASGVYIIQNGDNGAGASIAVVPEDPQCWNT